jgi:hypothetical protein
MFYVEHMKNTISKLILLILCAFNLFFLASCSKRDPSPELSDVIFVDLKNELEIAQKNFATEEAQNTKAKSDLDKVVPQTGQIKYAKKRYFESLNNLDLYKQQVKYFEITLALRRAEARSRYLESLVADGRAWPDAKEIEDYRIRLKLQKAKLVWNKKPDISEKSPDKKDVPRGTPGAPTPAHTK